ncbi:methyltransferase [Rickettsia endosymbiont of Cardiosporidium cionae]|uniref:methyltransferase n=1 Tax=Rickettsia endosymbiont of Cardiosporidium cionae TaxID=2777155 RepID=UPI001895759F|nr:methyltransferase [Rickettsia endosymbiont of Cardiosporidium cionae]KAF8818447.1 3-hydroxy-5-methyl-1-naphthoate 3-O-methyltransferase [Rickettsia endosymbiont of Cardiosporidium cionae]
MSGKNIQNAEEQKIRDICYRVTSSKAVFVAIDIGLFDYLQDGYKNIKNISAKFSLDYQKAQSLTLLCYAEGLLLCDDQFNYRNTEASNKFLCSSSKYYYGDFVRYLYMDCDESRSYNKIKEAILHNKTVPLGGLLFSKQYYEDEAIVKKFTYAMHAKSLFTSDYWPEFVDLENKKLFVDLGGGLGTHSVAVCKRYRKLNAIILDMPSVTKIAQQYIENEKLGDRIRTESVNFLVDDLFSADVYFLADILHDWPIDICRQVLSKVFQSLHQDGLIIIHEIFLNDLGTGPLNAVRCNMSMNIFSSGRQYSKSEITQILYTIGFTQVNYSGSINDWGIIVAKKS